MTIKHAQRNATLHSVVVEEFELSARARPAPVDQRTARALLHLLGFDREKFTYRYASRDFRLTDVHGNVVRELIG